MHALTRPYSLSDLQFMPFIGSMYFHYLLLHSNTYILLHIRIKFALSSPIVSRPETPRRNSVLRRPPPPRVPIPPIKTNDIDVAEVAATRRAQFRRQVERRLRQQVTHCSQRADVRYSQRTLFQGLTVSRSRSPSAFKHRRLQRPTSARTRRKGSRANRLVQASTELAQR